VGPDHHTGWLVRHDLEFDEIYFGKPHADVYIDNRAIRFSGWEGGYARGFWKEARLQWGVGRYGWMGLGLNTTARWHFEAVGGNTSARWSSWALASLAGMDYSRKLIFVVLADTGCF